MFAKIILSSLIKLHSKFLKFLYIDVDWLIRHLRFVIGVGNMVAFFFKIMFLLYIDIFEIETNIQSSGFFRNLKWLFIFKFVISAFDRVLLILSFMFR